MDGRIHIVPSAPLSTPQRSAAMAVSYAHTHTRSHTNTPTVRPPFSGSGHILAGTAAPAARPALQLARRGEGDASGGGGGGGGGGSAAPKQRVDPFGGAKPRDEKAYEAKKVPGGSRDDVRPMICAAEPSGLPSNNNARRCCPI